ncbi:MAG: hypothetical protein FWH07_07625 [Oscillospiraceae bacterium]|nr:hypothetical protein [Oscillospiraceae bacterium]
MARQVLFNSIDTVDVLQTVLNLRVGGGLEVWLVPFVDRFWGVRVTSANQVFLGDLPVHPTT